MSKVIAAYGGGFKPPQKGHFQVVEEALDRFPEIDEFIIYVGSGERNGISQAESVLIWEIYQNYLPMKVKIEPAKAPIGDIIRLSKKYPQDTIYFVIGAREGNEDDQKDIESRTRGIEEKKPNMKVKVITTKDGNVSGTRAREAAKVSPEELFKYLPEKISDEDKQKVYDIVGPVIKEVINENATYSTHIDYKYEIDEFIQHMLDKGMDIEPLPKIIFRNGDEENAKNFLGKTAYYDPNTQTIVLYTEGRHPKDIVRSFAHEMIHHIQNLEDRLEGIGTTNTMEDDHLNKIEQEAYLNGNITFRNWTDSLQEKKDKDYFGLNQFARELAQGLEEKTEKIGLPEEEDVSSQDMDYVIYSDMDGVIVDFEERFKQFSDGVLPSEFQKAHGRDKFWDLIDNQIGVKFWVGAPWMPDGKQYWDYIEKYNPILLSSPSRQNESRLGKRLWVKKHIPGTPLKLAYSENKKNYARENAILIDDRKQNIDQWVAAGGIGIWHTNAENTIAELKKLGL